MRGDLYGCYLRVEVPGRWAGPWARIVRLKVPAGVGLALAKETAAAVSSWLPEYASAHHRDRRAAVNMAPVADLERHLHRLQGDPRWRCAPCEPRIWNSTADRQARYGESRMRLDLMRIGRVDGSVGSNSRAFHVVTELLSRFEGTDLPSVSASGHVIDLALPANGCDAPRCACSGWCRCCIRSAGGRGVVGCRRRTDALFKGFYLSVQYTAHSPRTG